MAQSNPKLPLTGRNIQLYIYIGTGPVQSTDLATTMSIDEAIVQYRDKYLGRDRDRPDEQTIGYDSKLELHYAGSALIAAFLAQKAARQNLQPVQNVSIGFIMQNRDGTADSWILMNCTTKLGWKFSGKDDRGLISLDVQAEDLKQVVGL